MNVWKEKENSTKTILAIEWISMNGWERRKKNQTQYSLVTDQCREEKRKFDQNCGDQCMEEKHN